MLRQLIRAAIAILVVGGVSAAALIVAKPAISHSASADVASPAALNLDPDIERALMLLDQTNSGRPLTHLVRSFVARGGEIAFEHLGDQATELVFGNFSGFSTQWNGSHLSGKIRINDQLRDSPEIIASIIAHEATHLQDAVATGTTYDGVGGCFSGEAKAFVATMKAWGDLRQRVMANNVPRIGLAASAYTILNQQYAMYSRLATRSDHEAALSELTQTIEEDYLDQCVSPMVKNEVEQAYVGTVK